MWPWKSVVVVAAAGDEQRKDEDVPCREHGRAA